MRRESPTHDPPPPPRPSPSFGHLRLGNRCAAQCNRAGCCDAGAVRRSAGACASSIKMARPGPREPPPCENRTMLCCMIRPHPYRFASNCTTQLHVGQMGIREAAERKMPTSDQLRSYQHYIDGASVPPASGAYLPTEDPYTGAAWARIARGNREDAAAAVQAADAAFQGPWSRLSATECGHLLWKLGELIQAYAEQFSRAGYRKGVVNVVTGLGTEVGEALVTHSKTAHIGFTGCELAGLKTY